MKFSWMNYLKDYRKEDVSKQEMIIKEKWQKTAKVIKEAFSDQYVTPAEAIQKVKTEFVDITVAPASIDIEFVKENQKYICDKIRSLNEGDIKIIINNGDKVKHSANSDMDEAVKLTEGKKKGKSKKDADEEDDEEVMPKKKSHHKKVSKDDDEDEDDNNKEVIFDEPQSVEDIVGDDGVKEVKIIFDKEKMEIEIEEEDKPSDVYEVTEDSAEEIIEFLKEFYEKQEYVVNFEEVGEHTIDDEDKENKEKEDLEGNEEEEEHLDNAPQDSFEYEEGMYGESDTKLSWKQFLAESRYHEKKVITEHEGHDEMEDVGRYEEPQKDMIGRACTYDGRDCNIVKEVIGEEGKKYIIQFVDSGDEAEVCDYELELEGGEAMYDEATEEATPVVEGECSLIDKVVKYDGQGKLWLVISCSEDGKELTLKDDKGETITVANDEKVKPMEGVSETTTPTTQVQGVHNPQGMGESVEHGKITFSMLKKKESTGSYTKSPMKPKKNIADVKKPSAIRKKESTGSYTKQSNMKTLQKQAQGMPKNPKKDVKGVSSAGLTKAPSRPSRNVADVKKPKEMKKGISTGNYTKTGGQKVSEPHAQGMPKNPKKKM